MKRRLGVAQRNYSRTMKQYKEWQAEGGDNWKDPHAGKHPAIAKAATKRDKDLKFWKNNRHISETEKATRIREVEAAYKGAVEAAEQAMKKENVKKIKISVKNLLNFLEMFTFLMMIEQR